MKAIHKVLLVVAASILITACAQHCPKATAGGYSYNYSAPRPVYGDGTTGSIRVEFDPRSPLKPRTMTFSVGGQSAAIPGTITGLSRTTQYAQYRNSADGVTFPAPPQVLALGKKPAPRDMTVLITVRTR